MNKQNLLDLLSGTIKEAQTQNRENPNERTADPSIFDFLKNQLLEADRKSKTNIQRQDGKSKGIFDVLLDKLNGAQQQNRENPNQDTAPDSIFEHLRAKINEQKQQHHQRQSVKAEENIGELIRQYNIDVSRFDRRALQQIQQQYVKDNDELDRKYAQYIYDLSQGRRR